MNLLRGHVVTEAAYPGGNIIPNNQKFAMSCLAQRAEILQMIMAIALRHYCVKNGNKFIPILQIIEGQEIKTGENLNPSNHFGAHVGSIELRFLAEAFNIRVRENQGEFGAMMTYGK